MEKLHRLINNLANKIEYSGVLNPAISTSSVGWHIQHILLTNNLIIAAIENSNPSDYKSKFTFAKFYVFTFHKIPRGKIKAPNSVTPIANFSKEDINNNFINCYSFIKKLSQLNENNFFEHPFFGQLNLKPATKFLEIHTKHHLSIIDDILKSTNERK